MKKKIVFLFRLAKLKWQLECISAEPARQLDRRDNDAVTDGGRHIVTRRHVTAYRDVIG